MGLLSLRRGARLFISASSTRCDSSSTSYIQLQAYKRDSLPYFCTRENSKKHHSHSKFRCVPPKAIMCTSGTRLNIELIQCFWNFIEDENIEKYFFCISIYVFDEDNNSPLVEQSSSYAKCC